MQYTTNQDEILVSGYLLKKPGSHIGRTYGNWHKRWCVLRKSQFAYYKDSNEHKPTTVIPIEKLITYKARDKFKISIFTSNKTFFFKAESAESFDRWCRALNELTEEADEDEGEEDMPHVVLPAGNVLDGISETASVNHGVERDDDEQFFEMYGRESEEHVIQTGLLHRMRTTGFKQSHAVLTNKHFMFSKEGQGIDLDMVVDCVEDDARKYDGFVVITEKKRYKFICRNDKELVDWIINFKSLLLARKRRESV